MSIKVGVRVRPFNQREIELNCRLCVEMQAQTTRLINVDDPSKNRDFAFDYSFWSHDEFDTDENGYLKASTDKYADQQMVYEAVGKEILDNAWLGYHCCLFAYGQTGSGKSYSMIGYGPNKGIVPISCEQIFNRISANKDQNKQFEVNVSMLEIYNERVQDLLIPVNKRTKEGLKIREHKTYGIFVEGLSKHYVDTYQGIQRWMDEGNTHRSVAATQMNANSSRAHTIISIEFKQKENLHNKKVEKLSIIYLVDLAGSERVEKTGAAGEVLKQAANINRSLTTLGMVISGLADKAVGKGKGAIIPYRDSCLTRILQNALGGNSKTLMICAISPANDNYEQTLSTLRYADQAKKIQNKAIVNENQTDKMIRELTQQNDKLKRMMEQFSKMGINVMDGDALQKFNQMNADFHMNAEMMKEALEEPDRTTKTETFLESKFDQSRPHLVNLNEDSILSRKIKYALDQNSEVTIGRKNAEPVNDVIVGGVGIQKHHAIIQRKTGQDGRDQYYLKPLQEKEDSNCYINGQMISSITRLFHEDRLIFGSTSTFLVIISTQQRRIGPDITREIDYEFAQEQLGQSKKKEDDKEQQQQREKEAKEKEEQDRKLLEKELQLQKMKQELQKSQQASKLQIQAKTQAQKEQFEQQLQKMKQEIEQEKKKIQESARTQKSKMNEKNYLENRIKKYIPMTIELNLIAKEFNRNIEMSVKLYLLTDGFESKSLTEAEKVRTIKIVVNNRELGYSYVWEMEKFNTRYQLIKEMWEKYLDCNEKPKLSRQQDPFWDPPVSTEIGNGFLTMLSLAYLLDNQSQLILVAENGQCGSIFVNLIPTDQTGEINLSQELEDKEQQIEPEALIGKPFNFTVVIDKAIIPNNYQSVYVEYTLKLNSQSNETFKTDIVKSNTKTPVFNYSRNHRIESVTAEMVQLMKQNHLCFKVSGQQTVKSDKGQTAKPVPPVQKNIPNPNVYSPVKASQTTSALKPSPVTIKGSPVAGQQYRPVQTKKQQQSNVQNEKKAIPDKRKPQPKKDNCLMF